MQMARALKGISVLVVDDDPDTLELMALGLAAVGATVQAAASAEAALARLETWRPDVILSDLKLPGADGFEFLALLRANPRLRDIPAAALSGALATTKLPEGKTFEKYLAKPSKLPEIVIALVTLATQHRASAPTDSTELPSAQLHAALAQLNTASECRYTSLLRFDDDNTTLRSIWTYDRERPRTDAFPIGLPVHASYCVLVREARAMCVIEDASTDPRVATHSKRAELARYLGAPLFRADGSMFGTLCCYDSEPRSVPQATRDALLAAVREIEPWLDALFEPPAPPEMR